VTIVPESRKQPEGRLRVAVPEVEVLSVYVPFALAIHVPLTWREPDIETFLQALGSSPAAEMSTSLLDSDRQVDDTVHVPTTLPPQEVPSVQLGPPVPAVPVPPVVPAVPVVFPGPVAGPHAPEANASAIVNAIVVGPTFVKSFLLKGDSCWPFFVYPPLSQFGSRC